MSDRRAPEERRSRSERRKARERRKNTDNRIAVIELAESDLRVAILQRNPEGEADQVDALTMTWRHEATSPNTEEGRAELTVALRELSTTFNLVGCQVRYVLGGRYCVTKAILGSTEDVKSELQQLQQRSRLYLLLGTGEKVLVSNSKPLDARHTYAVASVCNAKTLETLNEVSERTGLHIESIEPALVANSRAVSRLKDSPTVPMLLIHMDHSAVEIAVSHQGRLLLEYRPGSCESPDELVETVRTHFGRLERHGCWQPSAVGGVRSWAASLLSCASLASEAVFLSWSSRARASATANSSIWACKPSMPDCWWMLIPLRVSATNKTAAIGMRLRVRIGRSGSRLIAVIWSMKFGASDSPIGR